MKKAELITAVSEQSGVTKREAEKIIHATFQCLTDAMVQGERVSIPSFGTFETKERTARYGQIPSTGERIWIPATTVPVFKPSKQLKEKLMK